MSRLSTFLGDLLSKIQNVIQEICNKQSQNFG